MKNVLFIFIVCLIAACSSVNPTTHYYVLSHDLGGFSDIDSTKVPVYFQAVTLADHLNQPALIMTSAEKQVQVASYHFWAEGLGKAVDRVLTYDLERHCKCRVLNQSLNDVSPANSIQLALHIEQMAADENGSVLFSGRFRLERNGQQKIRRFRFQQEMKEPGYESAVAVKRQLVTFLGSEISSVLSSETIGR